MTCTVVWCGVVWCGVVRCGAVRCGAVRCGAVRCGAVRCGAVRCGAVRCGAVRCGAVRCGAVRCGAVRCGAKQGPALRLWINPAKCALFSHTVLSDFPQEMKVSHEPNFEVLAAITGVAALTTELRKHSSNDTKCKELDWVISGGVVWSLGKGGFGVYLPASFSTSHLLVQGKVSGSYRTLRAAGPSPGTS
ncbi:hypothetical protein EMCRGX_G006310 [Ephydatia muelleri]